MLTTIKQTIMWVIFLLTVFFMGIHIPEEYLGPATKLVEFVMRAGILLGFVCYYRWFLESLGVLKVTKE